MGVDEPDGESIGRHCHVPRVVLVEGRRRGVDDGEGVSWGELGVDVAVEEVVEVDFVLCPVWVAFHGHEDFDHLAGGEDTVHLVTDSRYFAMTHPIRPSVRRTCSQVLKPLW